MWAGRAIFIKRKQLRSFNNNPALMMVENPFTSFKTTEIHVTSELASPPTPSDTDVSDKLNPKSNVTSNRGYEQYSIKIERGPLAQGPPPTPGAQAAVQRNNRTALEANTAAWGYTKCALMFFVSLMITWVRLAPLSPSHFVQRRSFLANGSRTTGPLLRLPRLLPHPPRHCLVAARLLRRPRPTPHGLLEHGHLRHDVVERDPQFLTQRAVAELLRQLTTTEGLEEEFPNQTDGQAEDAELAGEGTVGSVESPGELER